MTPCRVFGIIDRFQLKCHALLFAYSAYMSLYGSSFVSAMEELFWESEELELNDWVSYMLEQYNEKSTCGIETELHSLCESTCRPLIQVAAIPHSNKEMELCMAARELCILPNDSVQHLDDSVPCYVLQCCFALFQWEIAWQPKVEGECFDIGIYYYHGKIFEGCLSVYMAMVMLYQNYINQNSPAWYTALSGTTSSVVQICTLMYGIQRLAWGILYGAFLKYNHYICCCYALNPWPPLVRMVYIYWLPHEHVSTGMEMLDMQQQLKLFDNSVFSGYNTLRHVAQSGFVLILWKIAWSLHWEHSEIASAEFNNNLLPDVIAANFIFLCYGAGGVVTWSVFATTFRPTTAYSLLDTMKRNNSRQYSLTLSLAFLEVISVISFELWNHFWSGGLQCKQLTWDPGGSTLHWWLTTCDSQLPFQGGRCMPTWGRHKWDARDAATIVEQGTYDPMAATTWIRTQVHNHQVLGIRRGYHCVPGQLNPHNRQWDPGGFL